MLPLLAITQVEIGLITLAVVLIGLCLWLGVLLKQSQTHVKGLQNEKAKLESTINFTSGEIDSLNQKLVALQADFDARKIETEQALAEAQEARAFAEAASKAKGTFLATMSHEVRTPLNCIRGLAEVLRATDPTEEQNQYLNTISRSVDALLAIIGNVLDYSKIEAGKLELIVDRFNLNDLVVEIKNMFDLPAKQKGLDYSCTIDSSTPFHIVSDRNYLRQVMINLVGNAIKFTKSGSVTLVVERERIIDEMLPPNKTFYHVIMRVMDTGIGIPDDKKDQLFVPFNQLVDSRTQKYEGTGLGLAICQRIIEDGMKGEIVVRDNQPQGTIMELHIPLEGFTALPKKSDKVKLTRPDLIKHALGQSFYAHNILVADDNPLNCEVMKAMLEKMGHSADFVYNGREAVDYIERNDDTDLILMDIMMPVMDGIEATQRIRAGEIGEAKKTIPIVALTAFALTSDKEEFLSKGVDYYLPKPVNPEALRQILTELARKKHAGKIEA